jgi:hypothetical protein
MKNKTMSIIDNLDKWRHILGTMLTVALMAPVAAMSGSPALLDLGTAGDFTILSKTGISVTGTTAIVGDIGISPSAATYITGFGLTMDATGTFAISSLVTGKVFAADYTDPTPTTMTTAVSDMETAYTDAAGRTNPDFTELHAGDITGRTLAAGLYKWSTGVLISAAGVTLSGSESDVWIFQIAQNLALANGAIVTLSGGAKTSNIFWQVAGQATLGTTASMMGIILSQTTVVMGTGATLNGRVLAQTAVTLDANAVTMPVPVGIVNNKVPLDGYTLSQNYLNNTVDFKISSNGIATLKIVDIQGREVAMLFSGEAKSEKNYRVQYNSSRLAKGLYFLRLEVNGKASLNKMSLVK